MNNVQRNGNYQFQQYWFLGFLGFIGIYELPGVWAFIQGNGSIWSLTNLLWLLWFLYFLPEN